MIAWALALLASNLDMIIRLNKEARISLPYVTHDRSTAYPIASAARPAGRLPEGQ